MSGDSKGEFVVVKVSEIGFTDASGAEGVVSLRSGEGKGFSMRSFSGESAMHMRRFTSGDRSSIPSIYNMVEEIADKEGLHLSCVKVFPVGDVLRADLQFLGRGRDLVLPGYRASDAIALALLYDAPIMLHRSLLESEQERDSQV